MSPKKIKRKGGDLADSTAGLGNSDQKNSKSFKKKLKVVRKSNREAIESEKIKKKDGNIANSAAELVESDQQDPKPEEVSKPSSQEFVRSKEAETASEVIIKHENKRKRNNEEKHDINGKNCAVKHLNSHQGNKEKKIVDERHEERKRTEQKSGKSIGGVIFMCNGKTKPDCFRYLVMGISTSRQDIVMRIRPGLKLFLYDFDLRLMYGIYEASSGGGMKLEPAAFSGSFPAQVRFKIHKDCLPLPEAVFKKAIKDSYDEKTRKFKTELTVEQVNRLTKLFRPAPLLHSNAQSSLPEFVPAAIVQPPSTLPSEEILRQKNYREQYGSKIQQGSTPIDHNGHYVTHNSGHSQNPLFLTEREYRSYGLRSERPLLPTPAPAPASVGASTTHTYKKYRFDYRGEQLQNNPSSVSNNVASVQKEPGRPTSLLFLNEKEYRAFGLKGSQELPSRQTAALETSRSLEDPMKGACNPYDDSTTSLVNRYLPLPGTVATSSEPYYLTGKGAYINGSRYTSEQKDHSIRLNPERERSHASLNYNQHYHHLGGDLGQTSSTVSSRYSFGAPSLSQQ